VEVSALKPNGNGRPLDIRARVFDQAGSPVAGAYVDGTANGGGTWSGVLADIGSGNYEVCNVSSFNSGSVNVTVNASKTGYAPGSVSGSSAQGDWCP